MALVAVVVALFAGAAAQLVGPGGMVEYSGGGGARRGWGTVSEPAAGFFVAGSTLKALNGVYAREHPERVDRVCNRRACQLAYVNHASGWTLALAEPPDGYDATGGRSTEWVFVDRKGRDAFGHRGETVHRLSDECVVEEHGVVGGQGMDDAHLWHTQCSTLAVKRMHACNPKSRAACTRPLCEPRRRTSSRVPSTTARASGALRARKAPTAKGKGP